MQQHEQEHGHDVDAECKALVRTLGAAGWLKYAVGGTAYGGADDAIDTRSICLIRETLARHSGLADFAFAMQGLGSGAISLAGTPEQKKRLQEEFTILLVRTYGGALSQVKEQTVSLKPLRSSATDTEVLVRTEIVGRGDPIQLDYRLEKAAGAAGGWKIYDLNVLGVWLVETYRTQFSQEINANGVDGLISSLAQRNKSNAAGARKS